MFVLPFYFFFDVGCGRGDESENEIKFNKAKNNCFSEFQLAV